MPPDPVALVRRSSGGSAVRLRARELDQLEHEVERRTRGQLLRIHAGEALMYRIRRRIRYRRRGGLSLRSGPRTASGLIPVAWLPGDRVLADRPSGIEGGDPGTWMITPAAGSTRLSTAPLALGLL